MCAFWTTLAYSSPRFYHKFPDIKPEFKIPGIILHIYEDEGGGVADYVTCPDKVDVKSEFILINR